MIATLATIPTPSGDEFKVFLECVCFVLAIVVLVRQALGKGVPQPMQTKEVEEPVRRGSYETHCKLNREAHTDLGKEIKAVEDKHNQLAREVSGVTATLETNGVRLLQMDQKIDRVLERLGLSHAR